MFHRQSSPNRRYRTEKYFTMKGHQDDVWAVSLSSPEDAKLDARTVQNSAVTNSCWHNKRCRYFLCVGFLVVSLLAVVGVSVSQKKNRLGGEIESLINLFHPPTNSNDPGEGSINLASTAFENQSKIPSRYTADGEDISPPLKWWNVPPDTVSFVLICDDPDAPSVDEWNHWIVYNIPATLKELEDGVNPLPNPVVYSATTMKAVAFYQGVNSWDDDSHGKIYGYKGPDPPKGSGPHRYVFRIFALDGILNLDPSRATKDLVVMKMKEEVKILAYGTLTGIYER